MPSVFINYRTSDSLATATLLDRELSSRFGEEEIFRAGRCIGGGKKFPEEIRKALRKCDVLLALIGPGWRDARTADGGRALDDEDDWVRCELVEALALGLTVIPVLLDRTPRLSAADVPEVLSSLPKLQNLRLDHRDPGHDIDRIIETIVAEVPALGGKRIAMRNRGNRPAAADGTLNGNFFLGKARVDGDVIGRDKHVRGTDERHG